MIFLWSNVSVVRSLMCLNSSWVFTYTLFCRVYPVCPNGLYPWHCTYQLMESMGRKDYNYALYHEHMQRGSRVHKECIQHTCIIWLLSVTIVLERDLTAVWGWVHPLWSQWVVTLTQLQRHWRYSGQNGEGSPLSPSVSTRGSFLPPTTPLNRCVYYHLQ
jgi:hypothetical protein